MGVRIFWQRNIIQRSFAVTKIHQKISTSGDHHLALGVWPEHTIAKHAQLLHAIPQPFLSKAVNQAE
jgi:hypothetical protein